MTASERPRAVPASPTPVAPRDASNVDGTEVTFVWEAVENVDEYRLQVAPTARFEDLVVDESVGSETAVTVGNTFSTDDETYFWRVRSLNQVGVSENDPIESFVSVSPDEVEDIVGPDGGGPITGLARADQEDNLQHVFEPADRFEREKEQGVAYEGVAASQIMTVSVAILLVVMVAVAVIFSWYGQVAQETEAAASGPQTYERLQRPDQEAAQRLTEYGVVDEEEQTYHIPIDRAMEIVDREYPPLEENAARDDS